MPEAYFEESFTCNRDGFGFAWREDGKVKFKKGYMKIHEAWAAYSEFCKKPSFPHVVHFRLGSPVCQELTHPFIISESSELVLKGEADNVMFHNGIVSGWKDRMWEMFFKLGYIPDGKISDTRIIAMMYHLFGENIFELIDGKFVAFGATKIKLYGKFEEEDGIWYSNNSYKPRITYKRNYTEGQGDLYGYTTGAEYNIIIDEFIV